MENENEVGVSLVRVAGANINELRVLGNMYYLPMDPDEILSDISVWNYAKDRASSAKEYGPETWLTAMAQSDSGYVYSVSMEGELHHNRLGQWSVVDLKCPDGLNDIWAVSDDELFTVGMLGERIHIVDNEIDFVVDEDKRRLNAVHGSSNTNVFAVGDNGLAMHYDGKKWSTLKLSLEHNLLSVLCISETETYVAGGNGTLLKWNGRGWEWIGGTEVTISSIAWYNGKLYAAAGVDGVFVLGNDGLEEFKSLTLYRLKAIGEHLVGVGNKLLAIFDGTGWHGGDINYNF